MPLPPPSTIGSIIRFSSSTTSASSKDRTSWALPMTFTSHPGRSCNAVTPATRSAPRISEVGAQVSLGQRVRDDVLVDRVDPVGEGVTGPLGPRAGHDLPRAPAEQERVGPLGRLVEAPPHDLGVEERH